MSKRMHGAVVAHALIAAAVIGALSFAQQGGDRGGGGGEGTRGAAPPDGITGEMLLDVPDMEDPAAMAKMMERYQRLGERSDGHRVLERFVGDWAVTQTMLMPGMPETTSEATAETKLAMGGKYLVTDYSGSMMGRPYNGMGVMGFDNLRRQFFQFWVDDFGTAPHLSRGGLSQDGRTITMVGRMDEPTTGEIGKAAMFKTTWIDEDTWQMEAQEIVSGEPFTVVRWTYERR